MKTLDLLTQLQTEQRANHATLVTKVDDVKQCITKHVLDDTRQFAELDKRLVPIEGLRRTLRWAVGAMFLAALTAFADFFVNHLSAAAR